MERVLLNNADNRRRKPVIEEWSIRFDSEMIRAENVRNLAIFLSNSNYKRLTFGEGCRLVGIVRDCEGLDDGTSVITAWLDSFKRIKTGQFNGYPYYMICVKFETGNKCYIYEDCFTNNLAELMKYYEKGEVVKPTPKFINEFYPYLALLD